MFTGLIEETGRIEDINTFDGGLALDISANLIFSDLKIDHSISVNGVCQTVIAIQNNRFTVQAIKETLDKTTFSELKIGNMVNLERAMRADTRLGGHFVQGHVNGKAQITTIVKRGENHLIGISLPDDLLKFCTCEGSVTIDGISLTISDIKNSTIYVSIIPHTWNVTNIGSRKVSDFVNIENDMFAKYIFQYLQRIHNLA